MTYENIEYKGLELVIGFDFTEGEPEIRYQNDGGQQGCSDEYDILEINHKGGNIMGLFEDDYEEIIELLIENRY